MYAKTLVTENSADLVNSFKSADDQPLQIKLKRNSQLQIFVEGVEVGLKGTCGSAARVLHQHGGLDFHKALRVKISSDRGNYARALYECVADLGIYDKVGVSLAVAHIRVCKSVELLGQYLKAFRKKGDAFGVNGDLSRFCFENKADYAHYVADIKLFEILVFFLSQRVAANVALYAALKVLNVAEGRFAHDSL